MNLELVDEDYEKRMEMARINCDEGNGDPTACHNVASFISAVKQDRKGAAEIFSRNCTEHNYSPSCFHLGRLYLTGSGVDQNDSIALSYFDQACKSKHTQACNHQGILLLNGSEGSNGVKPDPLNAVNLMQFACEQGASESCYHLGNQYLKDHGVLERSPKKAHDLFEQGCNQGNGPSCFNLAVMYKRGEDGVPANPEKFKKYANRTKEMVSLQGGV